MQPLKIPFQESPGWQLFTGIPAAWVALPSLPAGKAAMAPRVEKIVAKSFKLNKLIFSYFNKFNYEVYILSKVIFSNNVRCPEKVLSPNALK